MEYRNQRVWGRSARYRIFVSFSFSQNLVPLLFTPMRGIPPKSRRVAFRTVIPNKYGRPVIEAGGHLPILITKNDNKKIEETSKEKNSLTRKLVGYRNWRQSYVIIT